MKFTLGTKLRRPRPNDPVKAVGATGIAGQPSERSLQPASISFPQDRPLSLVGYTGGWTMGSHPRVAQMNTASFGQTNSLQSQTVNGMAR
jgi:hypothetical protein